MTARVVTVIGGSGFIGRYLVQALARTGSYVRVAVRDPIAAEFLKPRGFVGQITPIPCNIRVPESVAAAVDGADAVVNLPGILYENGRQTYRAIQAEGPRVVAEASAAAGVSRLIQMSAIGADPRGAADYARSKAAGEEAAKAAFPDVSIVRPSVVFGPEDGLFNMFANLARFSPVLPLIGGGTTRFQPVYVYDVAEAMTAVLERDDTRGKTYELGGPRVYTFKEMLEIMLEVIRRERLLLPLPFWAASLQASLMELLPKPLLTQDQVKLLKRDNVVGADALTLADLGIAPTAMEGVLPTYLDRFRPGGQWSFKTVQS